DYYADAAGVIDGGAGNDYLMSHGPGDDIRGGDGVDAAVIIRTFATSGLAIDITIPGVASLGDGTQISGVERLEFSGGSGDDAATGGLLSDQLRGGGGADYLAGQDGDDALGGEAGNDVLLGGAGNDWLDGHAGDDTIVGGDGDD